ncbi:immunoglobulin domain-containing protein, partial [Pontibacter silvestris]|nr:hypothetical protein [Pontibacter silvestris]
MNPVPGIPSVTGVQTICYNTTTTLTATSTDNTVNFNWYNEAGEAVSTENPFQTPALTSNITYTVKAVNAAGCEGPGQEVTVTVIPALDNNSISTDQIICSGSTAAVLTGTKPTSTGGEVAYRYLWQISQDGNIFTDAPGVNNNQDYTPLGSFSDNTWFRRMIYADPCQELVSNTIKIEVSPLPEAPSVSDASVCYGSDVTLQVSSPDNNLKYQWYDAPSGGNLLANSDPTGVSFATTAFTSSTFYVESVNAHGCSSSARTPVSITVTPALIGGDIISSLVAEVCSGSSPGELSGAAPTGGDGTYTYVWFGSIVNASEGFNELQRSTDPNYNPGNLTQRSWFKRVVISGECTVESNIIEIGANPIPVAPV